MEYSSFEYASISMTLHSKKCLVVIGLYRKQEISFTIFQEEFAGFVDKTLNKGVVALVMGDFNVWVDVENDADAQKLTTLMSACWLTQMVHGFTHRAGHTLDHVYVNQFELELQPETCQKHIRNVEPTYRPLSNYNENSITLFAERYSNNDV